MHLQANCSCLDSPYETRDSRYQGRASEKGERLLDTWRDNPLQPCGAMSEFKSQGSFRRFARAVKERHRYFYDDETREFLDTLMTTLPDRIEEAETGGLLWRAQLGGDWQIIRRDGEVVAEEPRPHPQVRMKPAADSAREGRANPKGIPYLYLATERETALAEVQPWIGSDVSVGQFQIKRPLRLVNCKTEDGLRRHRYFGGEPSPEKREKVVWSSIDAAFSRPVTPSDDKADYVPTQILAECFRSNGFDGVAYRSSLGEGHNIVLFDPTVAELVNCFLFRVDEVKFEFTQSANPYSVVSRSDAGT